MAACFSSPCLPFYTFNITPFLANRASVREADCVLCVRAHFDGFYCHDAQRVYYSVCHCRNVSFVLLLQRFARWPSVSLA